MWEILTWKRIRSMAITRKIPTPKATVPARTKSGTAGTCRVSTCRSGSANVNARPSRKLTRTISQRFRDSVSFAPISSPIGITAMSAPRVMAPMPRMSRTIAGRKSTSVPDGRGARVK